MSIRPLTVSAYEMAQLKSGSLRGQLILFAYVMNNRVSTYTIGATQ